MSSPIEAVTFDFYNTLAYHRTGRGRGSCIMRYLTSHGFEPAAWEHQVLYDLFEPHGREYSPTLRDDDRRLYHQRLTLRLFRRLSIEADAETIADHAAAVWEILGPSAFELFPESIEVLRALRQAGIPTAIVSNWQCGLQHFCAELGVLEHVEHVVASAEVGSAKPDARIFEEACRLLRTAPDRILHVGDTPVDDVDGATNAGIRAILVNRNEPIVAKRESVVRDLREILALLGVPTAP